MEASTQSNPTLFVERLANLESKIPRWVVPTCKAISLACCVFVPSVLWGYHRGIAYEQNRQAIISTIETEAEARGWLSSAEAAAREDVSTRTIQRWCSQGKIDGAVKVANHWRIPLSWTADGQGGQPTVKPDE